MSNRVTLAVIDLETRQGNCAYRGRTTDVEWFNWVSSDRLLFGLGRGGLPWSGVMGVNRDGSQLRELIEIGDHKTRLLSLLPNSTNEVLVTTWAYSGLDWKTSLYFPHVDRMNIFTGTLKREVTNPGRAFAWWPDHEGVVRVCAELDGTRVKYLHRATPSSRWELLASFNYDEDGWAPVEFGDDNQTLYVSATSDTDTAGVYSYDLARKKLGGLGFRHAEADVRGCLYSRKKRSIVGVGVVTDRPQMYWLDADYVRLQAAVDSALPNTLNLLVDGSRNEDRFVVLACSDRTPGTFYLLDAKNNEFKLEKLLETASWIDPEAMAEMKPIEYLSRDGLKIHGYLTLPQTGAGTNLPLVVYPHGGPEARDVWWFDPEVQFLANRGYAVLQMNFRGSTGYGKKFLEAGYRQWGLKQQDDITDGVQWAIEHGIADRKRIAILGASYGGFAALTGLEKTPELYRCGICYAGVTDIARSFDQRYFKLPIAKAELAEAVGDPKNDKKWLAEISPINHVDKIQAPVLLAYGKRDSKVPIATGREMAKALKKRGKLHEFIEKEDEGHGFLKKVNQIEFWTKVDAFLKQHMN